MAKRVESFRVSPQGEGRPGLRERLGAAFEALSGTPSSAELEDRPVYRPTGRELVLAGLGAVSSRLENPAGLAVVQAEVLGIVRRMKTMKGCVATVALLGLSAPVWAEPIPVPPPAPTPRPPLPGYATFDATANLNSLQQRMENWTFKVTGDNYKYFQYLNAFLLQYKNYKLARQMYNRVASGRVDLVLLPALPTITFSMPVAGDQNGAAGSTGPNGVETGNWTKTTIHFMSSSQQDRDAIFGKLPNFAPKVNLGSQLLGMIKNLDIDPDVVAQRYDANGKLIEEQDAATLQRNALADALTTWMFSYHKEGASGLLEDVNGYVNDRLLSRQQSEDAALQLLYKVVTMQKAKDDAAIPYNGPSFAYRELLKTYAAMLARRRSMASDPDGLYQAEIAEANSQIAQTNTAIEYYAGQTALLAAVNQAAAEGKKKAAEANKNYGSKDSGTDSSVKPEDAAKVAGTVLMAGKNDPANNQLEFLVKQAATQNVTNEMLQSIAGILVGKNVWDEDAKRAEKTKQDREIANRFRTEGWVIKSSMDVVASVQSAPPNSPPVIIDSPSVMHIYGRDQDGNLVTIDAERPPEVKIVEIDPNSPAAKDFLTYTYRRQAQAAVDYAARSANAAGSDMANAMKESGGAFGGDFLSQLYRVVMAGFKSIFKLNAFDLNQDAKAISYGNTVYKNFNIGYNWKK